MNDDLKAKICEFIDLAGGDTERVAKRKDQVREYIKHDKFKEAVALPVNLLRIEVERYKKEQSEKIKNKTNEQLFLAHYTSVETVFSIIENKETDGFLRLYDAFYLNDPKEGKYLKSHLRKTLAEDYKWLNHVEDTDAFVCSFVGSDKEIGDELSFWHSYGKGGLGCSIQLSERHSQERVFHPVLYGKEYVKDVEEKFRPFFTVGKEMYNAFPSNAFNEKTTFAENFWKAFDKIKFMYKNDAYQYENEYRMVRIPESDIEVKYDLKSESLYPYLRKYIVDEELSAGKIFATNSEVTAKLAKVTIGPAVRRSKHLCENLKKLAKKRGILGPCFTSSKIPYQKFW